MAIVSLEIYRKHTQVNKKNKKVLYAKLNESLYGCLKSALLFYQKLSSDLKKKRFTINLYGPCVAKKW